MSSGQSIFKPKQNKSKHYHVPLYMIFNKQNHTAFFLSGLDNSKRANPQGICHLVSTGGGEFVKKPLPRGGALVNSSRQLLLCLFNINFTLLILPNKINYNKYSYKIMTNSVCQIKFKVVNSREISGKPRSL